MHVCYVYSSTIPKNDLCSRNTTEQIKPEIQEPVSIKRSTPNVPGDMMCICILWLFVLLPLKCYLQEPLLLQDFLSLFSVNYFLQLQVTIQTNSKSYQVVVIVNYLSRCKIEFFINWWKFLLLSVDSLDSLSGK